MAVLSCTLLRGRDYTRGEDQQRTHTDQYQILCDRVDHTPFQVEKLAQHAGPHALPELYAPHVRDKVARVKTISVRQADDAAEKFTASVTYDTKFEQPQELPKNPLARPVRYYLELMQFERVVDTDNRGRPIVNSLGMPFDPPLMQDDSRQVLVAVRNIANIFELTSLQQTYKDAINTNPFYGAKPRQAKIVSITSGEEQRENAVNYFEVAIRVAFRGEGDTWDRKLLNVAMKRRIRNSDGSYRIADTDKDGNKISSPIMLNRDGTMVREGVDEPVWLTFRTYPERDFRGLGI